MTVRPWIALAAALTACGPSSDDPAEPYRTRGDESCARLGGPPRDPTPCGSLGNVPGGVAVWTGDEVLPLSDVLRTMRVEGLATGELTRCDQTRFPLSLTCRAAGCPGAPVVLMAAYVRAVALEYIERDRVCW